jgi:Glycosyltransferase family 87
MRSSESVHTRRLLPWLLVFGLVALRVATVAAALSGTWPYDTPVNTDAVRYHEIASAPGTPYRDFEVEQAPVTLAFIEVINDRTFQGTQTRLMWSQLVLDLVVAAIVVWGWGRRAGLAYLLLGLPFVLYPFLYLRLDLLSVALAIGAMALVRRRRAVGGGALLAVASLAKLWSFVLIPSFVVRKSWRALTAFIVTFGAGLIAWVAWSGTSGPRQVLTYRGARGWQIESSVGVVLHAVSHRPAVFERGAMRIGEATAAARFSLLAVGVVLVLAIWLLAARIHPDREHLLDSICPLAAISALLLTSTLLSPQYAAWLLPFAAIAAVTGDRLSAGLAGVIGALSVMSVELFNELTQRDPVALSVVMLRNLLLLALYCVVVRRLWKLARPAAAKDRPRSPARSRSGGGAGEILP